VPQANEISQHIKAVPNVAIKKVNMNNHMMFTVLKLTSCNCRLYLSRGIDYSNLGLVNTIGLGISSSMVKSVAANLGVPNASSSPE
jgi:hypothetical protein